MGSQRQVGISDTSVWGSVSVAGSSVAAEVEGAGSVEPIACDKETMGSLVKAENRREKRGLKILYCIVRVQYFLLWQDG